MKVTFWSSEISALFLSFFLPTVSQVFLLNLWVLLWRTALYSALKYFSCWLVPSALFALLSFPFFLVPARFGLSRAVPNPPLCPSQAVWVQQFWQFTLGVAGDITGDNLWLAAKPHLTMGCSICSFDSSFSLLCSCSPAQRQQQVVPGQVSLLISCSRFMWHFLQQRK